MNVEKRADGWYASLTVPPDVRELIGRSKFLRKLSTTSESKGRASQEASPIVSGWKREIKLARDALKKAENPDSALDIALNLRNLLAVASNEDAGDDHELISDEIDRFVEKVKEAEGDKASSDIHQTAFGYKTPLEPLYHEWSKSKLKNYSLKTGDSYRRDAKMFVDKFVHLEAVTKRSMKEWIAYLMEFGTDPQKVKPMTLTTLRDRFMCGVRHFYNYIDSRGLIDEEKVNPMEGIIPKEEKTKINLSNKGWIPFDPKEVSQIYNAIPKDDDQLSTVTAIAMFTGMRIEEVCSLTVAQIIDVDGIRCFDIVDSKTRAGIRVVPIHPLIAPLVDRLLEEVKGDAEEAPKDEFLISGLKANKYDDRSNAVGKRFGRLKKELGFDEKKVFHSIRKCVVTQLDRAGYRETSIANLVGHDNPNMTAGRYSAGIDAPIMKPMIESLKYPAFVLR
ncbi:tyrosine-type recombinase/integrase [Polynucleobacter sp.]|uniref:tyrosine-type recombinase/integrase n=1 Tax=Polynucleobacter sp. TaxID=2029855 RepID=UPI003F697103